MSGTVSKTTAGAGARPVGRPPILQVEDLEVSFSTRDGVVRAVDGVSWEVAPGETLGIVGESGSGKTVSALAVLGLIPDPPGRIGRGRVLYGGKDLLAADQKELGAVRGDRIATVFQDPMTSLNPVLRIGTQVGEPLRVHRGLTRKQADARAVELLAGVGIPSPARRAREYPHEFSGGMRQRAMIAMALACEPDVLIADEPTTALDVTIQAQILELLGELQDRTGTAIVLITHDLGVVAQVADRVLVMYAGRMAEYTDSERLFGDARHPYTWGLVGSVPRHDRARSGSLAAIPGQPPSLIRVPSGCPFHPRCGYAQEICSTTVPPAIEVADGHTAACHFAADAAMRERQRPA